MRPFGLWKTYGSTSAADVRFWPEAVIGAFPESWTWHVRWCASFYHDDNSFLTPSSLKRAQGGVAISPHLSVRRRRVILNMTLDRGHAFQVGGHYRGVRFRVTVWKCSSRPPYVSQIDFEGALPILAPLFETPPATVNDALDMGFRLACQTIALR